MGDRLPNADRPGADVGGLRLCSRGLPYRRFEWEADCSWRDRLFSPEPGNHPKPDAAGVRLVTRELPA
jgi:hypothetical protein